MFAFLLQLPGRATCSSHCHVRMGLPGWFVFGGEAAFFCQIYNAAAVELAKTCPVCLHALDDFNTVYAGAPLSDALVKYGNSTLNLLRVANATLRSQHEPGSAELSAMASNASLLLRTGVTSSGRGRLRLSCLITAKICAPRVHGSCNSGSMSHEQ